MNIDDSWPALYEAEARVLKIQTKLHQWAISDRHRASVRPYSHTPQTSN